MGILQKISKKKAEEDVKSADEAIVEPVEEKAVENKVSRKSAEKKPAASQKDVRPEHSFAYRIIRGPVLTEKSELLKMGGKYAFFVAENANKVEVAQAIKAVYGVDPVAVRMISVKGKLVRHGRFQGRRKDRKKAIVTLKSGDSISLAESA
ncbi:MAG: 50S ribosomal protein L23 [bacterium]